MKMSVITPVFINSMKEREWFEQCNGSINNSVPLAGAECQRVIVDDGSTVEIGSNYRFDTNLGVGNAMSKCVELATGDILVRIDADDYIDRNYLKHVVNDFKEHPDVLIVTHEATLVNADGSIHGYIKSPQVYSFKRELFEKIKFKPLRVFEDTSVLIDCLESGVPFYHCTNETLYFYRQWEGSTCRRYRTELRRLQQEYWDRKAREKAMEVGK